MCRCSHAHYSIIILQYTLKLGRKIVHFVTINNEEEKKLKLQQLTVFTIFVIVKITTVLILLKLRYL